MDKTIQQAALAIKKADAIFISAGAGMGVDSGLPDFRGNEGFWRAYPVLKNERLSFQDLANPQWFKNDPNRAWGFYGHRLNLYRKVEPHAGFKLLRKWGANKSLPTFVFTTNVDGHFQKSGFDSECVLECHGSINHLQCQNSCHSQIWEAGSLKLEVDETRLIANGKIPICPKCTKVARPNILMFGDIGWNAHRADHQYDNYENWKHLSKSAEVVTIEMGAGKDIPTARHASDSMPGTTVRINPRDSDGNRNTISIAMGALEALKEIDSVLKNGFLE